MNENQIRFYDSSGTTPIDDPERLQDRAEQIRFSTVYPGGIFDSFSCFIPCDPTRHFPMRWGQRIIVRNGLTLVWEGFVSSLTLMIRENESGYMVDGLGYIALAHRHYLYHRYIDRRFSSDVRGIWEAASELNGADKCTYDNNNRLYFVPKEVAWGASERAGFYYGTNAGGNVARVDFNYYLSSSNSQTWGMRLIDVARGTTLWSACTSTSASAACSISLPAASSATSLYFTFRNAAAAACTPVADGGVYGKITNLAVFGEDPRLSSQSNVSDIIKSLSYYLGYYSASLFSESGSLIATNTYDLTTNGFVCDDFGESIPQIAQRAGTFSASNLAYSVGIRESEAIAGNTQPVLYYEQQPATTDYEYSVRLDDQNLSGLELVLSADPGELYNVVNVSYRDSNGKATWVHYGIDARLRDTDSRSKYLSRWEIIETDKAFDSYTAAADYGARFLNGNKNLKYYVRAPLRVSGTIQSKAGQQAPVSHVRAGQRLRIENFMLDVGDISGAGLTFLISRTEYDDETQSVSISCGLPDDLAVFLARQALMNDKNL